MTATIKTISKKIHVANSKKVILNNAAANLSLMDWLWSILLSLAFTDVMIRYFGDSLSISILRQPWIVITALLAPVLLINIEQIAKLKKWTLLAFTGLLISLLIGYFTIEKPSQLILNSKTPFQILPSDLLKMIVAFFIGALWISRPNINGKFTSDLFLLISLIHTLVCLIAVLKISPSLFPVVDKPYFRDGRLISRPEITTDQTRQALYLFMNLCVIFTQRSNIKRLIAVIVSVGIVFIISKVQSRWSSLLFAVFFILSFLMAIQYKKISFATLLTWAFVGVAIIFWKSDSILVYLEDLIWRFKQVDSSYGGRLISIVYLSEKIIDPNFWIPHGFNEFFKIHGAAPHSFPTMVYLNGGLLGLFCYISLTYIPLYILLKKVIKRKATEIEQIAFFCGSFAVLLSITQPVIHHEIFWLIQGLVIGSYNRKERKLQNNG